MFLVLCPFTMQSHIFFTDGMEWKIVSAPVILPPPGECLSIYRLEGDSVCDGFRWFKMYYTVDANPESRRFAGMVRTEGIRYITKINMTPDSCMISVLSRGKFVLRVLWQRIRIVLAISAI